MAKYLMIFFLFQCLNADLWVEDESINRPDIEAKTLFVSLGSTCVPAALLRQCGLRNEAFPLDWLMSLDNEGLIKAIRDGFDNLLNDDFLVPDNFLRPHAWGASLVHLDYNFEFVHEGDFFGSEFEKNRQNLTDRYQRRIERFRKLDEFSGTIVFLRCSYSSGLIDLHRYFKCKEIIDISDEDSLSLYLALKERFPASKIKLIIMNEGDPLNGIVLEKKLNDDLIKIRHSFQSELFQEIGRFLRESL